MTTRTAGLLGAALGYGAWVLFSAAAYAIAHVVTGAGRRGR